MDHLNIIKEVTGDLFELDKSYCLAHWVSVNLRMGAGIAVLFREKFGGIAELREQRPEIGGVCYLKREGRYIFYLVTKAGHPDKPTYQALQQSLQFTRVMCESLGVRKLAMPKLGWGLDGLDWQMVKPMIVEAFAGSGVELVVCIPPNKGGNKWKPYRSNTAFRQNRDLN